MLVLSRVPRAEAGTRLCIFFFAALNSNDAISRYNRIGLFCEAASFQKLPRFCKDVPFVIFHERTLLFVLFHAMRRLLDIFSLISAPFPAIMEERGFSWLFSFFPVGLAPGGGFSFFRNDLYSLLAVGLPQVLRFCVGIPHGFEPSLMLITLVVAPLDDVHGLTSFLRRIMDSSCVTSKVVLQ